MPPPLPAANLARQVLPPLLAHLPRQVVPGAYGGGIGLNGTAFADGYNITGPGFWIFIAVFPLVAVCALVAFFYMYGTCCTTGRWAASKAKAKAKEEEEAAEAGETEAQQHTVFFLGEEVVAVPTLDMNDGEAEVGQMGGARKASTSSNRSTGNKERHVRFQEGTESRLGCVGTDEAIVGGTAPPVYSCSPNSSTPR